MTSEPELFAITLYVPDATAGSLGKSGVIRQMILRGVPELDFVPPPWWEVSHTVRLGLAQTAPPREG